jgi:molybdate-binding protein
MIHNLGSKTYIASLLGADSRNASANGTGFDLQGSNDAEGEAIVILDSEAGSGTSPTLDVKLQESANNSTWSDISGATFTQVTDAAAAFEKISINTNDVARYVRAVGTSGGTTPVFVYAVSLVYSKKYGN